MKRAAALPLCLLLLLCPPASLPALAAGHAAGDLTAEAAKAYLAVVDGLCQEYGAPYIPRDGTAAWGGRDKYYGMCGGYIVNMSGVTVLLAAYAPPPAARGGAAESRLAVYSWWPAQNSAVLLKEYRIHAGENGWGWSTFLLHQSGGVSWLEERREGYDYATASDLNGGREQSIFYTVSGAGMAAFTPRPGQEETAIVLGAYNFILFNNCDELRTLLGGVMGNAVKVTVNGQEVDWPDARPFIDAGGRTMVPLRAVADRLGIQVEWNAAAREAVFSGYDYKANRIRTIRFPIGSKTALTETRVIDYSRGNPLQSIGTVEMDTAAVISANRTYAPVRYLAEFFGRSVGWDEKTYTVRIT